MINWTKKLESRLASLRLHPAREREIVDELSGHLELATPISSTKASTKSKH
jgi:hypothetical protein